MCPFPIAMSNNQRLIFGTYVPWNLTSEAQGPHAPWASCSAWPCSCAPAFLLGDGDLAENCYVVKMVTLPLYSNYWNIFMEYGMWMGYEWCDHGMFLWDITGRFSRVFEGYHNGIHGIKHPFFSLTINIAIEHGHVNSCFTLNSMLMMVMFQSK